MKIRVMVCDDNEEFVSNMRSHFAVHGTVFRRRTARIDRLDHALVEHRERHGLHHVKIRAEAHRFRYERVLRQRRHDDNLHIAFIDAFEHRKPVERRHDEIEQ